MILNSNNSHQRRRQEMASQPIFEKRRIVGSLRERTIFVPTNVSLSPFSSQQQPRTEKCNEKQADDDAERILQEIGRRLSERVEIILNEQQIYIDSKIAEIDEHVKRNMMVNADIEKRLKKLKKFAKAKKKKNYSNINIFSEKSSYAEFRRSECTSYYPSCPKPPMSVFTTLW